MNRLLCTAALLALVMASCQRGAVKPPAPEAKLSPAEQEVKAMEVFTELLEAGANLPRPDSRDMREEAFRRIIRDYPDSDRAQECYYRLMELLLDEQAVPREDEAEALYREYFSRYDPPQLNNAINVAFVRHYHSFREWDKLKAFIVPIIRQSLESGRFQTPYYLFYYTEAVVNLHEYDEAERGYRLLIRDFPRSFEAKIAKQRLAVISEVRKDMK